MEDIFFDIFLDLPQGAPGSEESLKKAYDIASKYLKADNILDIGCGSGKHTIFLSSLCNANISAVDLLEGAIERFKEKVKILNLEDRISPKIGDMNDLNFPKSSFDIIWSEGAIYNIGVERGINYWKEFLKKEGLMVFTECVWTKDDRPEELIEFWENEYPDMKSHDEIVKVISDSGFELIDSFLLTKSDWWDQYYIYLEKRLDDLWPKYKNNPDAKEVFDMCQNEVDVFKKYNEYYNYSYYIIRKK